MYKVPIDHFKDKEMEAKVLNFLKHRKKKKYLYVDQKEADMVFSTCKAVSVLKNIIKYKVFSSIIC